MNHSFRDTEELSLALKHTNVRAMQSGAGPFKATLSLAAAGGWSLQFIRFEQGASVCAGDAPAHNYAFVVPLRSAPRSRLLGQDLTARSLGVYAPGSEHADATSAGCEHAVIVAPADFAEVAQSNGVALARRGSHVMQARPADLARLQRALRSIGDATQNSGLAESAGPGAAEALSGALTDILQPSEGEETGASNPGRPPLPRPAILRRVLEILEAREDEPLFASELAAEAGISQSSLQRAFNEWFDMPPARYLAMKRLYLARQRLRNSKGETVTAVASALGFWDQSRFARNYKAVFGELPSETLRQHARM